MEVSTFSQQREEKLIPGNSKDICFWCSDERRFVIRWRWKHRKALIGFKLREKLLILTSIHSLIIKWSSCNMTITVSEIQPHFFYLLRLFHYIVSAILDSTCNSDTATQHRNVCASSSLDCAIGWLVAIYCFDYHTNSKNTWVVFEK